MTPHNMAKPKKRHSFMRRLPISDSQPMGRAAGVHGDRQRWHILQHGAPLCGVRTAGEIDWHAPYIAVKDQIICKRCHGRFSWRPVAHDVEHVDLGYLTPCLVWTRGVMSEGYGSRGNPEQRMNKLTHREAYEDAHGEIPEGYVVHHLCGQKTCLNPEHLEAVSRAEHIAIHRRTFDYAEAARLYRGGMGPGELARTFGVKRGAVKAALERMRKRGEL